MLQPTEIVALAKVVAANTLKATRPQVGPGTYPIDMRLHITGSIKVGEDYDVAPTVSIPLKRALALFIVYAGLAASEAAMASLVEALYDSIETTGKSGEADFGENEAAVEAFLERIEQDLIQRLPRTPRTGPVTPQLNVAEIGVAQGVAHVEVAAD